MESMDTGYYVFWSFWLGAFFVTLQAIQINLFMINLRLRRIDDGNIRVSGPCHCSKDGGTEGETPTGKEGRWMKRLLNESQKED